MAFYNSFKFAPPKWLPFQDQEILDSVVNENFYERQGKKFENPDFELKVVFDVHNYFATDLFHRIRLSDVKNEKLVIILSSPENAVFISVAENLNKYKISARNVHVFFLYEYANENGKVAPWQSPYSRSGQFMKNFYFELEKDLRMPIENIHFWADNNIETYSKEIEDLGGADVCYTALSWSSGIGAIDPDGFPAKNLEDFLSMGSRLVTPMPEMIAHDSLRGMFGCAGDLGNVPPKAVTVGPKDLMASKEWIDVEYLVGCGATAHQKFPLALSMFGPICKEIPGSIMRLHKGTCYVAQEVAINASNQPDFDGIYEKLEEIKNKEEKGE
jgi:6-phosphogluconolactonase/glucosamine-6-phosphate isomerase/deaminase